MANPALGSSQIIGVFLKQPANVISTEHEGAIATEGEWRDPEDVCAAMLPQGILPRDLSRTRILSESVNAVF